MFGPGQVVVLAALAALAAPQRAAAFRTGAPSLACMNMRPMHGLYQARPASASQFFVRQSSLGYASGQNVTVEIMTQSSERHFRGFMLQSYNPLDGKQIGRFEAGEEAQPMGCASATHRNNKEKTRVSVTWVPDSAGPRSSPAVGALGDWLSLAGGVQKRHAPASTSAPAPQHQVRFRATIVVSYSEFYTGFESSELKFERFDYSPTAAPSAARGMVNVAVAVSPRANATAVAVASSNKWVDSLERPLGGPAGLRPVLAELRERAAPQLAPREQH